MKIPAQQSGNPLAACYCSQLEKALSEVNYAKPLKRQFLSQMQDSLCNYLETHPDTRLEDLYAAFGTPPGSRRLCPAQHGFRPNQKTAENKPAVPFSVCGRYRHPCHGRGLPVGRTRHQPLCQPAVYY